MSRSIVWFRHDLRLHDNEALLEALRNADELIPIYIFDFSVRRVGPARLQFLIESVKALRQRLENIGSFLIVRTGDADQILYQLALETQSQWVYCNRERTKDEVEIQDRLEKKLWTIGRELRYARGKMLFHTSDLPFPVTQCPDSFSIFKKAVEHITPIRPPFAAPTSIPRLPEGIDPGEIPELVKFHKGIHPSEHAFVGGEEEGLRALSQVGKHRLPFAFMDEGTGLSPWISMGCLSPKMVYAVSFEKDSGGEQIRQHLLYRDYLRLMGKKYGDRIFYKSGVYGRKVAFDKHKERYEKWKSGNTGVPIVDAAMHQLNQTGWIPEVLRKMVAGYFVRVLQLDWRLGASWFEYTLIDYDPCTTWVSWQNIAGIGPDAKEDKIIHYDNVGKKLDPDGSYIRTWMH